LRARGEEGGGHKIVVRFTDRTRCFSDGGATDLDDQMLVGATVDSWQDNWLFQKKKITRHSNNNYHHHPVPVPMLVPNPCEVTRPLIGDRDADETSELSDYSNSALDELLELCNVRPDGLTSTRSM